MNTLYVTIAVFALAAILGLTILIRWLSKKDAPKSVVYSHGAAAATALVLLIIYAVNNPDSFPKASLILFVLAALGGFYMFFRDKSGNKTPLGIAVVHALLAVSGFAALLIFVFA